MISYFDKKNELNTKTHILSIVQVIIILLMGITATDAAVLLDVKSFKVSKNYPAEFLFDLTEGDNLILSFNKVGGNVDVSKVAVEVIDLNDIEETVLDQFRIPSGNLRIPSDGKYLIRLSYSGKDITFKGRKFGNFSLKVESLNTEKLKGGEFRNVLQLNSIAIDDDQENALKVIFKVKKGDIITFSSADPKSSIVKVYLQQLGKTGFVNSLSQIIAPQDYYLSCNIFLADNDDPVNLYNVRELLKNGDLLFTDLVITQERPAKALLASNTVNPDGSGGSSSTSSSGTEASSSNPYDDYLAQLQEQQNAGADNSSAIAAALQNSADLSAETLDNMIEYLKESTKPKEIVDVFTIPQADIKVTLGPAGNLFRKNKNASFSNKHCQELALPGTNFNKWFYWVGVGKKAGEAFEEEVERFSTRNGGRKQLTAAKAEYIYYMNDPENSRFNPSFPSTKNYPAYFSEDVEYAIVDDVNKDRFLRGENYLFNNYRKSKYVTVDESWSISPPNSDTIYWICFCNNNERTPVDVIFKYFTIDTERTLR